MVKLCLHDAEGLSVVCLGMHYWNQTGLPWHVAMVRMQDSRWMLVHGMAFAIHTRVLLDNSTLRIFTGVD